MYNLIEYSANYFKTFGSLWNYYRDEPFLISNGTTADFSADNNSSYLFKFKTGIAGRTENYGPKTLKLQYH